MKISVIGTGYVGLVTGTCFAEAGNEVVCVDINAEKIERMKKGIIPIFEPDLDVLFKRNLYENRIKFTTSLAEGIKGAQIIFLALPTPPGDDGSADLSYILGIADEIGPLLSSYAVIVDKSTVPVGTAEKVRLNIEKKSKVKFDVVSNPEFLREGLAVSDFMKPDRIVIGTSSKKARDLLQELYSPFLRQGNPIYFMDERSAEMTKYAANSFLATKISFMNEIANICELVGANVDSVRLGIGSDDRIGNRFLFPGIGYGGSCFPKDVLALQKTANENNYNFKILEAVVSVNKTQKEKIQTKIMNFYKNDITGKKFALWGLSFKPDTDDIREAPSLEIINHLTANGAKIVAYDPEAINNVKNLLGDTNKSLSFTNNAYDALKNADALVIATEWSEFRAPNITKILRMLKNPVIFDGRNLYDLETMKKFNIHYESIGRKTVR